VLKSDKVAGCSVLLFFRVGEEIVLVGGLENAGKYRGCFNMAGGKHDVGETRLTTMSREFDEEMGRNMSVRLSAEQILAAHKTALGKSIVALIEHRGAPISREEWDRNNDKLEKWLHEFDTIEFFSAREFPCNANSLATTWRAKEDGETTSRRVPVSSYFVRAVNAFKQFGLLPVLQCRDGDKCWE
jgi:8-oxo-dGTP pyrophosphatase MutT (NUDIX family)